MAASTSSTTMLRLRAIQRKQLAAMVPGRQSGSLWVFEKRKPLFSTFS
jgi:hypothetical protein